MPTTVFIPTPLRPFTDQQATVQVAGANVGEVLKNLVAGARGAASITCTRARASCAAS